MWVFFLSHWLSSPFLLAPSYSVIVTQMRGHIPGSSPSTMVRALDGCREKGLTLSYLVDSRRIAYRAASRQDCTTAIESAGAVSHGEPTCGLIQWQTSDANHSSPARLRGGRPKIYPAFNDPPFKYGNPTDRIVATSEKRLPAIY